MNKRPQFPTPIQDIVLNLIFVTMGEKRANRTYSEYMAIAAKIPPLKVLTFKVNKLLQELHKCDGCNGVRLPELCRFRAGDERINYEPYPDCVSCETIRNALEISGMREPRWRRANTL
jgi:recombinational DNA repair protein RecR